jgi:pyruvate/2-oxoglutarate dehydrogenase complex dihydrolipoamide dehydrogenase (E3) component
MLDVKKLPKKMCIVGCNYIGMQMGQHFRRMGVDVCMIETRERPMMQFDKDIIDEIVKVMEKNGIKFCMNTCMEGAKCDKD